MGYVNKDIDVDLLLRKNPRSALKQTNKTVHFEIGMIADGNHAFLSWVESLARSSQCLFYFHVQRCGRSREVD